MAALSSQDMSLSGLQATYASAAGGGDTMPTGERNFLHVKNGSGGAITVTVDSQLACDQGSDHDAVASVAAGQEEFIGPITPRRFNNSSGTADISYSGVTSLTVAVVRIP